MFPRAALQGGGEVTVWLEPNKVSRTPRHALAMDLTWLGNDGEPVEGGMFDKTGEKPVVVLADASGVQVNCLDTASSGSDFGGICINDAAVTPRDALEPAAGGDEPSAGAPGPGASSTPQDQSKIAEFLVPSVEAEAYLEREQGGAQTEVMAAMRDEMEMVRALRPHQRAPPRQLQSHRIGGMPDYPPREVPQRG